MDNTPTQPVDPTALALKRAIFKQEGNDYSNTSGDNGTSAGAGQWNNGKLPLKKGEVPANFKSSAQQFGLDPNDFSETAQDHVGYLQVKKDLDDGLTQSQIAAKWNSGLTHGWENHKGTTTINGKSVSYDTPAYVANVQKYYEEQMNGGGGSNTQSPSTNSDTPQTFEDYLKKNPSGSQATSDLKAGNPTTPGNTTIGNAVVAATPGTTLAQGLGYALSNATGTQDKVIEANNQGIDIEGKLLKQIKDNKAKGKDTSRLEKALKGLIASIQQTGNSASDVGTGGITNSGVLNSAAGLAALPVASYLSGALSGGGVLNEGKGLVSGVLSKASSSALTNPEITNILEGSIGKGETLANLSRQDAINTLGNYLKEMPMTESGGKTEQAVLKALKELNPTLLEKKSLIAKIAKSTISEVSKFALYNTLGNKVGGLVHGLIPK